MDLLAQHQHNQAPAVSTRKTSWGSVSPESTIHNGRIALPCAGARPSAGNAGFDTHKTRTSKQKYVYGPCWLVEMSKVQSPRALEIDSGLGCLGNDRQPRNTLRPFFLLRHRQARGCLRSTAQPIHVAGLPVFQGYLGSVLLLHG